VVSGILKMSNDAFLVNPYLWILFLMHKLWIFLHLVGIVVWVGGMFFMLHCLRPSLDAIDGPQRPKLMLAVQGKFFKMVTVALVLIWSSGLAMLSTAISNGLKPWPIGWHIMIALAALMTLLFLYLRFSLFARAQLAFAQAKPGELGPLMESIRKTVMINMILGFVVIAAAIFGR
jgi:uncharacterized membrane protein